MRWSNQLLENSQVIIPSSHQLNYGRTPTFDMAVPCLGEITARFNRILLFKKVPRCQYLTIARNHNTNAYKYRRYYRVYGPYYYILLSLKFILRHKSS